MTKDRRNDEILIGYLFWFTELTSEDFSNQLFIDFENEATYKYARTMVEKNYRRSLRSEKSL